MKKVLSITLSIIMLVSVVAPAFTAQAGNNSGSINVESLYSAMPVFSNATSASVQKTKNGNTYYGDGKQLYNQIRAKLDSHSSSVSVRYYNKDGFKVEATYVNQIRRILNNAWSDELSVTSTDGDYARWSLNSLDYDSSCTSDKNGYYYDLTIYFGYYASDAQEKQVDSAIDSLVQSIRKKNMSDYNTIKYVQDYICSKTKYNYKALSNPSKHPTSFSAYGALIGGECVCQGYASAFYRICKELGYKVRFVYSDPNRGCHAWNMIMLDGQYYFVDCTWDDQIIDENMQEDFGGENYYFLINYDKLTSMDRAMEKLQAHYLDDDLTDDSYFINNYYNKLCDTDYELDNSNRLSTSSITLSYYTTVYNGTEQKPSVVIKNAVGDTLKYGTDYTLSYTKSTNCGTARVAINGLGDYANATTYRTYTITPSSKVSTPKAVSGTRTASAITIEWSKISSGIDGYQVQMYKNGAWTTVKTITSPSTVTYKATGLSANQKCQFRVRAYKNINRVTYYAPYSSTYTTYTTPKTPTLSLSTKSKAITAKWKKVTCSGYEIQYSTSSSMKNAKKIKASLSAVSKKISKLKKGKKYYVRIRSYKTTTVDSKKNTYYSPWSAKKSITVK